MLGTHVRAVELQCLNGTITIDLPPDLLTDTPKPGAPASGRIAEGDGIEIAIDANVVPADVVAGDPFEYFRQRPTLYRLVQVEETKHQSAGGLLGTVERLDVNQFQSNLRREQDAPVTLYTLVIYDFGTAINIRADVGWWVDPVHRERVKSILRNVRTTRNPKLPHGVTVGSLVELRAYEAADHGNRATTLPANPSTQPSADPSSVIAVETAKRDPNPYDIFAALMKQHGAVPVQDAVTQTIDGVTVIVPAPPHAWRAAADAGELSYMMVGVGFCTGMTQQSRKTVPEVVRSMLEVHQKGMGLSVEDVKLGDKPASLVRVVMDAQPFWMPPNTPPEQPRRAEGINLVFEINGRTVVISIFYSSSATDAQRKLYRDALLGVTLKPADKPVEGEPAAP